jgi:hypothetical protein
MQRRAYEFARPTPPVVLSGLLILAYLDEADMPVGIA